jgi:hypothetical protein
MLLRANRSTVQTACLGHRSRWLVSRPVCCVPWDRHKACITAQHALNVMLASFQILPASQSASFVELAPSLCECKMWALNSARHVPPDASWALQARAFACLAISASTMMCRVHLCACPASPANTLPSPIPRPAPIVLLDHSRRFLTAFPVPRATWAASPRLRAQSIVCYAKLEELPVHWVSHSARIARLGPVPRPWVSPHVSTAVLVTICQMWAAATHVCPVAPVNTLPLLAVPLAAVAHQGSYPRRVVKTIVILVAQARIQTCGILLPVSSAPWDSTPC